MNGRDGGANSRSIASGSQGVFLKGTTISGGAVIDGNPISIVGMTAQDAIETIKKEIATTGKAPVVVDSNGVASRVVLDKNGEIVLDKNGMPVLEKIVGKIADQKVKKGKAARAPASSIADAKKEEEARAAAVRKSEMDKLLNKWKNK
jgi:NADPH-dependent glutamate synthase beta subunit-like oxidoreductase